MNRIGVWHRVNLPKLRKVVECGSPLPLFGRVLQHLDGPPKRQKDGMAEFCEFRRRAE